MAGRRIEELLGRRGLQEGLRPLAALFGALVRVRSGLYGRGVLRSERLEVPVVSVGNITLGGTGKTPAAAFLARALRERGLRPGILSRGYKRGRGEERNDEAAMLGEDLPDVPHVQDTDRAAGGRALVERGVDAIVLDDGFQTLGLHRDLDLVLVDALRPWGLPAPDEGTAPVRALLPRGFLREPPSALARADGIVLTRVDLAGARVEELERSIAGIAPGKPVLRAVHRARALLRPDGRTLEPHAIADREVDLVSGVGNPEAFERTVVGLGARVREHRAFADHHAYGGSDLAGLGEGGRWLVTTAKDAPKIRGLLGAGTRPLVLSVELELVRGAAVLEAMLDALVTDPRLRARRTLHEGLHG